MKAIVPPALIATAHSLIVTSPEEETNPDQTAPTPGVLTGETETAMPVVAPATAVVFCTQVPAVVAVAKAAEVALITCAIWKNGPLLLLHFRVDISNQCKSLPKLCKCLSCHL